jgi:hypothetical protein
MLSPQRRGLPRLLSGCQPGPGQTPGSWLHAMKLLPSKATTSS